LIARYYKMEAGEGKADYLLQGLTRRAEIVKAIPGCNGVDLMQDVEQPGSFIFIEKWISVLAHKDGASMVPKEVMNTVMEALVARPEAAYLQYRGRDNCEPIRY
jgi:quinol monooxygenase YgiN